MKKYGKLGIVTMCLLLSFLIFSCTNKSKKEDLNLDLQADENAEHVKEEKIYKTMEEFEAMLGKKSIVELIDYVDKNVEMVGKENADKMVYGLEEVLAKNLARKQEALLRANKDQQIQKLLGEKRLLTQEDLASLGDQDLRAMLEELLREKYVLVKEDQDLELAINYDKFLAYNDFVTESARDYLNIESKRLDMPTLYRGNFNIELDYLGERLLNYEAYIVDYPDSKHFENVLIYYRRDLISYLRGTSTSPIILENTSLNKDLVNSYKSFVKNKDSVSSSIVRKYLGLLEKGDYRREDLDVEILSLVNQALNFIEDKIE